MTDPADRELDIVLFGATGFVGRRAAHHLAARLGNRRDPRWAIAGRNQAALARLHAELGAAARDIPILIADSHDSASLDAMVARTKLVCSTVGPYAKYGSELLAACVRNGTHYCDITGEAHWIRKMIDAHQGKAEDTGARIVPACGMDSVPSDLGVYFLQREAMKRRGSPCPRIKMRVVAMRGGISHGTAATLLHGMEEGPHDPTIRQFMVEPYSLNPEGEREGPDAPDRMSSTEVTYDDDLHAWTKPFVMGPINSKIVRRSNALLGYPYGRDFRYEEAWVVDDGPGGWVRAKAGALGLGALIAAAALPPSRWLLKKFVLPAAGEGPDEHTREGGFWRLVLLGDSGDGNPLRARVGGIGDPAVESTSRMLVETALCLTEDSDRIRVGGGIWTPASAVGDLLLSRLTAHAGLSFAMDDASLPYDEVITTPIMV